MLLSVIYFLPCIVSLLWFVSFLLKKKNYRQRMLCYSLGTSVIFYALLGIYFFPDIDYDTMVRVETISIPFGLVFPAFLVAYMYMHCSGRRISASLKFGLLVPAIVIGVSVNLLCYIIGFDKAAEVSRQFASPNGLTDALNTNINRLYCFFTYYAFIVVEAFYVFLGLALCLLTLHRHGYKFGDVFRFFFRGKATVSCRAISFMFIVKLAIMSVIILCGSVFFSIHVPLGVLMMVALATVKHLIAHVEFYSEENQQVTLYGLSHLTLFGPRGKAGLDGEIYQPRGAERPTVSEVKMEKRFNQFRELMEDKKVWMDEDLSAASLCEMLGVGRTTLSAIVSQMYDATLREVITRYRIEEAKEYMSANPKATQDTVAAHCGFRSAQYFNTQFKKLVGDTPSMWLASSQSEEAIQ